MSGKQPIRRIGVLTGGGDCPGLNAVIRAVVKTGLIEHGFEAYGVLDGFEGLVKDRMVRLDYEDVSGILTLGGTILGTSNTANPFKYVEHDGDPAEACDLSQQCFENFEKAGLDVLFCIGGDGSLSIAHRLAQAGMPIIGVPKTIDNDLYGTDVSFGFDTAVQVVAEALDRLHTTAMSHHRAMVIETMGRYAGWLALVGGMAGGGDVILIPEIPYALEKVCEVVAERSGRGRRFSIIVISEGVKQPDGDYVVRRRVADSSDQIRLGGIGVWLARAIDEMTPVESRAVVLGHIQRGGTPSAYDRVLATRLGHAAMLQAAEGNFDVMVGLQGTEILPVPLTDVAGRQRLVDPECQIVRAARSVGTSFGDE
ncbi:MAG: 6-phosphofructokinase [Planctomycetota bacterium]|jgi:6-phosphofructokinase 1